MQQEADAILSEDYLLKQYEDAASLNYIEAVAYKTLRLKSVVPLIFLEALEDHQIKETFIAKGTAVFLLTRQGAMQDKAFIDGHQLIPKRWIDKSSIIFLVITGMHLYLLVRSHDFVWVAI